MWGNVSRETCLRGGLRDVSRETCLGGGLRDVSRETGFRGLMYEMFHVKENPAEASAGFCLWVNYKGFLRICEYFLGNSFGV